MQQSTPNLSALVEDAQDRGIQLTPQDEDDFLDVMAALDDGRIADARAKLSATRPQVHDVFHTYFDDLREALQLEDGVLEEIGVRGPLEIGTDEIVNAYARDTPGQEGLEYKATEDNGKEAVKESWLGASPGYQALVDEVTEFLKEDGAVRITADMSNRQLAQYARRKDQVGQQAKQTLARKARTAPLKRKTDAYAVLHQQMRGKAVPPGRLSRAAPTLANANPKMLARTISKAVQARKAAELEKRRKDKIAKQAVEKFKTGERAKKRAAMDRLKKVDQARQDAENHRKKEQAARKGAASKAKKEAAAAKAALAKKKAQTGTKKAKKKFIYDHEGTPYDSNWYKLEWDPNWGRHKAVRKTGPELSAAGLVGKAPWAESFSSVLPEVAEFLAEEQVPDCDDDRKVLKERGRRKKRRTNEHQDFTKAMGPGRMIKDNAGKIAGTVGGALVGGPHGAVFGLAAGLAVDRYRESNRAEKARKDARARAAVRAKKTK